MTKIWTALGITILIFTLAFTELNLTKDTSDVLVEIIEKTEISAKNNSNETESLCGDIKDLWDKRKFELELFLPHNEMDQIDISIENLKRYCEIGNFEKVYIECGILKNYINSMVDSEGINFHNLF